MKIFISFDYEGLGGVSNWKETLGDTRFDQLATEQLNAFISGIKKNEETAEIYVADSHAKGNSIIWEQLPAKVFLIKGYPRRYYMVEGLKSGFSAFILFGYHAPAGEKGCMDHTYSSSTIYDIEINGRKVDEAYINTLVASHYNVPLKFVYTDSGGAEWMRDQFGNGLNVLESKDTISRFSAVMKPFELLLEQLKESGEKLMDNDGIILEKEKEYEVLIRFLDSNIAYAVQIVPGFEKVDARTARFRTEDVLELYRYIITATMVGSSVKDLYR